MNIFISDSKPIQAAINLDDKRLNKMVLESTQLLCGAINLCGGQSPYKTSHANHPSALWCRQTQANWLWLYDHAIGLANEYTHRRNKIHGCHKILLQIVALYDILPTGVLTPFANCTTNKEKGISFKHIEDTVMAYRQYLIARWNTDKNPTTWLNREKPSWLGVDNEGKYCYTTINE